MEPALPESSPKSPLERALLVVLLLILMTAAARNTWSITRLVNEVPRAPQWDMARRGLDGIHLAEALRRGEITEFISRIHQASVWPPVFPLLETPAFLIFGQDYRVPRLLVSLLFLLCIPAIFWTGRALDARWGTHMGLVAAGFLCASPLFHLYAGLVMLEVPGTLLLLLCLGSYARALGSANLARWRMTWCLTTVLFFCKFNYGLMWLLPVLLAETWRANGTWAAALHRLASQRPTVNLRQPWNVFVLAYLTLVMAVLVFGGFETEIAGIQLRLKSIGSPLYHLYVLGFLRWMLHPRRNFEHFRTWLSKLEPRHRQFVNWVVLPIAVWMLLPPHMREFFHFVQNRSSGMPVLSWESLSLYPRILIFELSPTPWLGAMLLVLAFLPCFALPRLGARQRALCLALLCGSAALVFHPYKLPRFSLTVAPLVWLSAAWLLVRGLAWCGQRLTARRASPVILLLCGFIMITTVAKGVHAGRLKAGFVHRTVPRSTESVIREIFHVARESETTAVLGTWNLLSPWLLEWHLRRHHPDLEPERWPRTNREFKRLRPEALCEDLNTSDVVILDPRPKRRLRPLMQSFADEIAPLQPVYEALAQSDCFELAKEEIFHRAEYRLRHYQRRPADGSTP